MKESEFTITCRRLLGSNDNQIDSLNSCETNLLIAILFKIAAGRQPEPGIKSHWYYYPICDLHLSQRLIVAKKT